MKFTTKSLICMVSTIAVSGLLGYLPAHARDLEEVVVTAQKRVESLQDVPLAISALNTATLERTDSHGLGDIAHQVPSLTFSAFAPGQNIVSMRGASSNDDGAGTDSSIAIFVDDVYLGRISNINPEMFDLERVEVLRGPQGTLYGKNTLGGALNIVSIRPNSEKFEGKIRITFGDFSRFNTAALFNGPLSDRWSGKIAFSKRERNGWVNNPSLSQDQKDENSSAWRGQLLYEHNDFSVLFTADYNKSDVLDMARVPLASDYNSNRGGPNPATFRDAYVGVCGGRIERECAAGIVDGYSKTTGGGVSAKVNWVINDQLELVSITAYRENEADWNMDSAGAPTFALIDDIFDETSQFSQEFRLLGNMGEFWDFVAGFWFLRENTDRTECFDRSLDSDCTHATAVLNAAGDMVSSDESDFYNQDNETKSVAVFANFNLNFTEQWQLSLGARFTSEEKDIQNISINGEQMSPDIIQETFENRREESWDAFTPKVAVRYTPWDHTSFYLSLASGFKSGGFAAAPQNEAQTEPLDQEDAVSFEIGVKSEPRSNLRILASLYHTEYEGLQIQTFGDGSLSNGDVCVRDLPLVDNAGNPIRDNMGNQAVQDCFGSFRTFNAGDAEATGLEAEITWLVTDNFTLSGYFSATESEFGETEIENAVVRQVRTDASGNVVMDAGGDPVVDILTDYRDQNGQDLLRTPELQYGINAEYTVPFSNGSNLRFNFDYTFNDDERGTLAPYGLQYSYRLYDASVAWTSASGNIELLFWGKNLGDETYLEHIYTIAASVTGVYGDPRFYGVTGTFKF